LLLPPAGPLAGRAMNNHGSRRDSLRAASAVADNAGLILARVAGRSRGYAVAHEHSFV